MAGRVGSVGRHHSVEGRYRLLHSKSVLQASAAPSGVRVFASAAAPRSRGALGATALAVTLLMAGRVQAAPNGLTQIPIAKVFGDGVASFSLARSRQSDDSTVYTAQYGVSNRFEVGLDYQAAPAVQRTFLGNTKLLLLHQPRRLPDVACGILNVAPGQKAVPYLVATSAPRAWGFSLGVIRPSGGTAFRGLVGLSYGITPALQVVSDFINGRENYATLGGIYALSKTVTVNLAYALPNDGARNPHGYVLDVAYTFHLKGGGHPQGGPENRNPAPGPAGQ